MRSDTELLKELLGVFSVIVSENELSWPFNEMVDGLRGSCCFEDDVVDELIERRKQLYAMVDNSTQQLKAEICPSCAGTGRANGDYCDSNFCTRCDGSGKLSAV
jgi:hypothetical protein